MIFRFSEYGCAFPTIIMLASIFFAGGNPFIAGIFVILVLLFSILITLLISSILGTTILKGVDSSFTLELPPYRKPQFAKVIVRSVLDRTIFVLGRAICVSVPAGALIWLLQNITVGDITILTMFSCTVSSFNNSHKIYFKLFCISSMLLISCFFLHNPLHYLPPRCH